MSCGEAKQTFIHCSGCGSQLLRQISVFCPKCQGVTNLVQELTRLRAENAKLRANRVEDSPQDDGTDAAHPAWWRGADHGVQMTCRKLAAVLDGLDDGQGVCSSEELETLRRRILMMRNDLLTCRHERKAQLRRPLEEYTAPLDTQSCVTAEEACGIEVKRTAEVP